MMKYANLVAKMLKSGKNDTFFGDFNKKEMTKFRILALGACCKAGVPVNPDGVFRVQYDGTTINAGTPSNYADELHHPSNIIHDLAHWSVCTSLDRRSKPDFGLGRGPDSADDSPCLTLQAQTEEERASFLGIIIEWELGMPAADTLRLHGWVEPWNRLHAKGKPIQAPDGEWCVENTRGVTKAVNWLVKQKLVSPSGRVNWAKVSKGCADI
jgi:hypothetical protein